MSPQPGDAVRVVMTKWGDRPHWEFDAVLLDSDEHGDWIGIPAGTHVSRPGADYVAPVDQVILAPRPDAGAGAGWLATFHASGGKVHTYVDVTTPPAWDGAVLRAVDLDLDVIRLPDGRVVIDDEDEFAEHQVELGYPTEIVALATSSCAYVVAAVSEGTAPFDGSAGAWFDRLTTLAPRPVQ